MKKRLKIINPLWTIMKVSSLQLFLMIAATAYSYAFPSKAQELLTQRVTVQVDQKEIREVLNSLESNTNVKFVYSLQLLPVSRKITLKIENKPLNEVLETMFRPDNISFKVIRNKIVLKRIVPGVSDIQPLEPILNFMVSGKIIDRILTGTVTDDRGEALPGVNIAVKGTTMGTSSDGEGRFSLSITHDDVVLVFSFVGYNPQEIQPGVQTSLRISLKPDTKSLDEIVVIGYGTTKRQDFTGSVSSLKLEGSAVALLPSMNALETLKGTLPGVDIGATNTAGGQPSVQVRGQNSISGNNDPLIVLDGVIFLGSLADINPSDISSFDVLKDATSAAA